MALSGLVQKARSFAAALLAPAEIPEVEADSEPSVDAKFANVEREFAALQERLRVEERISREYFEVIERIEKERDQWKDMFFTQSSEHQNAQAMLQKMLADCSNNLRGALTQLNFLRKAAGIEPVVNPAMLEKVPTDLPEKYGEKIAELAASARPQTDGRSERAKIAETRELPQPPVLRFPPSGVS